MSRRKRLLAALDQDMQDHIARETQDNIDRGMAPAEARSAALRKFGNVALVKEDVRAVWTTLWLERLWQDVCFGWRMLRKNPGFAGTAVLTLALGIGANTAMFTVINAVLLQPLPFKDRDRLVMVWERNFAREGEPNVVGPANFIRWREQNQVFEDLGAFISVPLNLTGGGEPERVPVGIVSPGVLTTLGVSAARGRIFLPEEEQPGRDNVVLLSDGLWKRRFGSDPAIVAKSINLSGEAVQIVGVMPPHFSFMSDVDLWTPLTMHPEMRTAGGRYLTVIARLKPGVSLAQAQADMDRVAAQTRAELAEFDAGWGTTIVPLREQLVGGIRRALLVLLGAVGFVLLIACANVANLLLARASARQKEMAIRAALGGSRGRLVWQLLTESVMLAVLGGIGGTVLAYWGVPAIAAIVPAAIPSFAQLAIDPAVLGFTGLVSLLTGIFFGLAPALRMSSVNPHTALQEGGRTSAGGARHRLRSALVVAEAATALVLLVGAGLLIRSFVRLLEVDPGFRPENVLTMQVSLPSAKYANDAQRVNFFQQAVERIQGLPGITAAGAVSYLPLDGPASATNFLIDDRPTPPAGQEPVGEVRSVTADYFRSMGIPLLQGRTFSDQDHPDAPIKKVVVNQALVNTYWPGQNPLGKPITMEWFTVLHAQVIGVVPDIKLDRLDSRGNRPTLYWFFPQFPYSAMSIVIHTQGDAKALVAAARAQIASIDPEQPVASIRTMEEIVGTSVKEPRFTMVLLATFAGLALALAGIGLYGVISYSMVQRTHELGIRMALGASSGEIWRLVIKEGVGLALVGVGIGVAAAFSLTRFLAGLLFGVSNTDPLTYVAVSSCLALVAMLASYIPARRATRVEPMAALRCE